MIVRVCRSAFAAFVIEHDPTGPRVVITFFCFQYKKQKILRSHSSRLCMKIVLIDGLNLMLARFPKEWQNTIEVIKQELNLLSFAMTQADMFPIFVLDLYRKPSVGGIKWARRQKRLLCRNRSVTCSASYLLGMALSETGLAWTYAVDMEADDLLIEMAQSMPGSIIVSSDKGFVKTRHRCFCVAKSLTYYHGILEFGAIAHCHSECICDQSAGSKKKSTINLSLQFRAFELSALITFYLDNMRVPSCTVTKGVFYPAFEKLPCMYCYFKDVRSYYYALIHVGPVRESHVCATVCRTTKQVGWDVALVTPQKFSQPFVSVCKEYLNSFRCIIARTVTNKIDRANINFAACLSCAQMACELWFCERHALSIMDSVTISHKVKGYMQEFKAETDFVGPDGRSRRGKSKAVRPLTTVCLC